MTLDEFLLVIYEMGKGHQQLGVNSKALEESVGLEYRHLFEDADGQGYLDIGIGQLQLTRSGKHRVALFQ